MMISLSRALALVLTVPAVSLAQTKAPSQEKSDQVDELRARQIKAAHVLDASGTLMSNGDFSKASEDGKWAADWGTAPANSSRQEEGGNGFIRLAASEPGQVLQMKRVVDLPKGLKSLQVNWRWRLNDVKAGENPLNSARLLYFFYDEKGKPIESRLASPQFRAEADGWVAGMSRFRVPVNAAAFEIRPTLFHEKGGSLDLDDIVVREGDIRMVIADEWAPHRPADPPIEVAQPEKFPKPIHVEGNKLVDSEGKDVWLQGVNLPGLEWNVEGESILRRLVEAIDVWKANVVRLPLKGELWNGPDQEAYRKLVDAAITMAANRGAYVVADLHVYRAIKPEHIEFWKDFAPKYKDHPAVIFDVINEPHSISWDVWKNGGFVEERRKRADEDAFLSDDEKAKAREGYQSPGMQAAVDAIRATGAKNVLVVGALDYSYDLSGILKGYAIDDRGGQGIMYSTHVYPWKSKWKEMFLDVAAVHPIFVGEVGADHRKMEFIPDERQEDPELWVPDMLGVIQKYKLNWTGWSFHPNAGPRLLDDWKLTPTPVWGEMAKRALAGEKFEAKKER